MVDIRQLIERLRQRGVRADFVKPRVLLPSYPQWEAANGKGMDQCHG
ncbi:hypothetical protein P4S88_02240 [Anoxybacillus geothermalis]|nr:MULTISPECIES: hypothetical protein [unclassified Geobacillus]AKM20467.1 hypothetical protein GARCT_03242 [Geobacillus sp. 12AMOR1]MED0652935.1 hypothetical protein [Anoxybacillus geothermalis]QOR84077.1 hypothetical protein IMZ17_16520 [Geobacillus stearothermophilus]